MPPVQMNVDYMRKKRSHSAKPEETIHRVLRQFTVSPQRYRFTKFDHKKLGVIHPEPTKVVKTKPQTSIPQPATYQLGEKEYMEIRGKKCPIIDVEPDIMYTKNDKKQLDEHLVQPFFYVQQIFPKGRPLEETILEHKDVFAPFQTLKLSKRNNRNLYNTDYIKILKQMSQQEREEFYTKGLKMNLEYARIFKRFIKALVSKGILNKDYKLLTEDPKIHKKQIIKKAAELKLIANADKLHKPIVKFIEPKKKFGIKKKVKEYEQLPITFNNLGKLLQFYGYNNQLLQDDLKILFTNVNLGDSPMNMLMKKEQKPEDSLVNLNAFLFNVQKFMKLKYKIKNLLSVNSAKQRNVYIKFSLYPFLGEGWRTFKKCQSQLILCEKGINSQLKQPIEKYTDMINERDHLIMVKRVWAKNLQRTPLQYILLKFNKVKNVYVNTINYNAERIDNFNKFQVELFQFKELRMAQIHNIVIDVRTIKLEEAVDFLIENQYPKPQSDQIIEMFQKILKFYGLRKAPIKSKWQLDPQIEPEKILTQNQIVQFLSDYSNKQNNEWKIFKQFIDEFYSFTVKKLNLPLDRLKHVRQAYECNIIGEWLIKKLKKLDQTIERLLYQSVSVCRLLESKEQINEKDILEILNTEGKISFDKFLNEKLQDEIKALIQKGQALQSEQNSKSFLSDAWDTDLTKAMQKYQTISIELNQNKEKIRIPSKEQIQPQTISAAHLIDDRSIVQEQIQPTQPVRIQVQTQPIKIEVDKPKILSPKQQITMNSNKTLDTQKQNQSSVTMLSEAELDMKIQNAMRLQSKIFSEIGNVKDFSFRSLK